MFVAGLALADVVFVGTVLIQWVTLLPSPMTSTQNMLRRRPVQITVGLGLFRCRMLRRLVVGLLRHRLATGVVLEVGQVVIDIVHGWRSWRLGSGGLFKPEILRIKRCLQTFGEVESLEVVALSAG